MPLLYNNNIRVTKKKFSYGMTCTIAFTWVVSLLTSWHPLALQVWKGSAIIHWPHYYKSLIELTSYGMTCTTPLLFCLGWGADWAGERGATREIGPRIEGRADNKGN